MMSQSSSYSAKDLDSWDKLTPMEQAAASILDWNPRSWEENMPNRFSFIKFSELTDIEKTAAKCLGYTNKEWDHYYDIEIEKMERFRERAKRRSNWQESYESKMLDTYIRNFKRNYRNLAVQQNIMENPLNNMLTPPPIVRQTCVNVDNSNSHLPVLERAVSI